MSATGASGEIWVLGGTGRSGAAIARCLADSGQRVVLVGRDRARLADTALAIGDRVDTRQATSLESMLTLIASERPSVVVNTVGPFAGRVAGVARAGLPHTHYVDLANDCVAADEVLSLDAEAKSCGRTLITGAGFGVVATESVVATLCQNRPPADRVRVDAIPSVATVEGVLGDALAATIVGGLPGGGRRYENGGLVRVRIGDDPELLHLPDGSTITTAGVPSGELQAAQRGSGGAFVVSASSEVPTGAAARVALPIASVLVAVPALAGLARRRLARIRTRPAPRPRPYSWARARLQWADGSRLEGWLRAGDASEFTAAAAAAVAGLLASGLGPSGAHTPVEAFGRGLATQAGGEFLLPDPGGQ